MKIQTTRIFSGLFLAICMLLAVAGVKANDLLGSSSSGSNAASIYSIDSTTGTATLIGSSGLTDSLGRPNKISAVALDPMSGTFYGIFGSACTGARLITIDPNTGAGTVVGALVGAGFDASNDTGDGRTSTGGTSGCNGGSDALIFADDGTLYAGGWESGFSGGTLLTVDKSTGAVLSVLPTDFSVHIAGLARAPDGTLWVSRGGNGPGTIHTIDPVTGGFLSTLLLSDTNARISDIAFSDGGTLFGADPRTGMLVTIDTVTGATVNVGAFGGGARISGLSPRAAEVPAITCADLGGCNPTGGLIVEIPASIPIPPGTVISQTVETLSDPRVAAGTCGVETLVLFDDDPDKPDLIIPEYICGDPFVVITTETDLEVLNDTIVLTNVPGAFFESPKDCNAPIPADVDPQLEDAVVWQGTDGAPQDDGFANTTTFECGSSRGRSRGFSHNVVGMSINFGIDWSADPDAVRQAFVDLGHSKYERLLRAVLLSEEALPHSQWDKLVEIAEFANQVYHWGWYELANDNLTLLLHAIEEDSNFDTSVGYNHSGNITTRADNLRFYTVKYVIGLAGDEVDVH